MDSNMFVSEKRCQVHEHNKYPKDLSREALARLSRKFMIRFMILSDDTNQFDQ